MSFYLFIAKSFYLFIAKSFYLFIAILCAKILCVNWAYINWMIIPIRSDRHAFRYKEQLQIKMKFGKNKKELIKLNLHCCLLISKWHTIFALNGDCRNCFTALKNECYIPETLKKQLNFNIGDCWLVKAQA